MGNLLFDHFMSVEHVLLAQSRIPANSGHSLHKGTPRENFIKNFLVDHLSERVAVGQGEIIDATSQSGEARHQMDIILYRRTFPRIAFDSTITAFLTESVVATIEVKSNLTKEELRKAIASARDVKRLQRNSYPVLSIGYQPPSILSYVVAYDGPASMKTVGTWLNPLHAELGISYPSLPSESRCDVPSPSLDGIFILGKGFIQFENSPLTINMLEALRSEAEFDPKWSYVEIEYGSLLALFMLITNAISGLAEGSFNASSYVRNLNGIKNAGLLG